MRFISFFIGLFTVFLNASIHVVGMQQPPQWEASWITASKSQSATNTWICFRKELNIKKMPKGALAQIAVDSKYWLWINGRLVVFEGGLKRGPTPDDTYYDQIGIGSYLKEGENTISVLVWYLGKDGFSHNSSGKAGLFFQCITPEFSLVSNASWKARLNPAYINSPPPYPNYRLSETNIYYDARKSLGKWYLPGYRAVKHGFSAAVEMGIPPCSPWNKLIKRPIPQWKDFGLKEYEREKILPGKDKDTVVCFLPYDAQITPFFDIRSEEEKKIEIFTDAYDGGGALNVRAGYITRKGKQTYESLGWMNGNKVFYIMPKGVNVNVLKYRETGYDTEFSGRFKCDDPFYNRLWEKARRTLYITMRDTYMDCPDRERAQWIGDVVNESGESFYALDTVSHLLMKKGMYELISWQRDDSTLFGPVPSGNWNKELPNQILAMIGYYGFGNYYLHTGDLKTISDLYEGVKKYVGIWEINKEGTVKFRKGGWTWGDWGDNIDTILLENAWYYLALKGMRNMAEALNKNKDRRYYQNRMSLLKKAFNRRFWNGKEYRSLDYKYETDDRVQGLAVVSGLANEDKYPALFQVLEKEEHASPYMEKYVLEALFIMGYDNYALHRMKKRFGPMVNNKNFTTLFEGWGIGKVLYGGGTFNHAWSGGGLTLLSEYVCGITPTTPGYKSFQIKPKMGNLHHAEAEVSSVMGKIKVSLDKTENLFSLDIKVPKDTKCNIYIPSGYSHVLCNKESVKTKRIDEYDMIAVGSGDFLVEAKK